MSERENMPGAFLFVSNGGAHEHQYIDPGMTLLYWFAGQALCGLLSGNTTLDTQRDTELSYMIAESMMIERAKRMEVQL